jgi:hypothetical protein
MTTANDNQDMLQNATEDGHAPVRRLTTPEAAYEIYQSFLDGGEDRAMQWSKIQGMYDRNPPFDQNELTRLGRGDQTNVNTGEMESIIDTNTAAAHEAVFEVPSLISVRIRSEYLPDDSTLDFAAIIADEYSQTVWDWDSFPSYTDLVTKDSFRYGMGFMLWRDQWDWRPRAFRAANFLCPPKASTAYDELEIFGVRDEVPVRWLYQAVEDEEAAKDAGWDVGFTRRVIAESYKFKSGNDDQHQTSTWESTQTKIRTNDVETEAQEFTGIRVVHLLVREVSSTRVSHLIIPEDPTYKGFLYKGYERFGDMAQVLWLLTFDNGDGLIRSVKGMGHRAFLHCDLSNRLFCNTIDGGKLAASLLVQPRAGNDIGKAQVLRAGMLTMIPSSLDVIQTSFTPPIQHLIPLRHMSSEILNNNLGVFRPRSENPLQREAEKTAAQVRSEESKEARFSKNQAAQRYVAWDRWHREVYRRMTTADYLSYGYDSMEQLLQIIALTRGVQQVYDNKPGTVDFLPGQKEAIAFLIGCLRRGVPPEILLDRDAIRTLRAVRAVGQGSDSARRGALNQLMAQRGAMDELSRRNLERDWTAAQIGGYGQVDRYFPNYDRSKKPSAEAGIAALENNDFAEGSQLPVGYDQNHVAHLPVHFAPLVQIAQLFEQAPDQVDAVRSLQLFSIMLPHIQEHIGYLAQDVSREAQVKQYVETFKMLAQVAKKLEGQAAAIAAQQDQAAQQQQAEMEELQRRADANEVELAARKYEIDRRIELDMLEVQSLHASRMAKTGTSIQANAAQTAAKIENERRIAEAEIEKKRKSD